MFQSLQGRHVIIDNGPLPEAVAASAAIPIVFENVNIPGKLMCYSVARLKTPFWCVCWVVMNAICHHSMLVCMIR